MFTARYLTNDFNELFAAQHSATDDLKLVGAEAKFIGDFSQAAIINDSCIKIQAFVVTLKAIGLGAGGKIE